MIKDCQLSKHLYPLLRRLEKQGLLESLWQVEDNRPRRYYQISAIGREIREQLTHDWHTIMPPCQNL